MGGAVDIWPTPQKILGRCDMGDMPHFDWYSIYAVCIIVVQNKNVLVSGGWFDGELVCLVRVWFIFELSRVNDDTQHTLCFWIWWCLVSKISRLSRSWDSGGGVDFVNRKTLNSWSKYSLAVAIFCGKCLAIICAMRPGQVVIWFRWFTESYVDFAGLNNASARYTVYSSLV